MTGPVAALPMYDWPEVRTETDRSWAHLRDELRARGIAAPEHLARCNADLPPVPGGIRDASGRVVAPDPATLPPEELDLPMLWRHPALLLAQTCWGPMEQGLRGEVTVVGQGGYSAYDGGEGELYSSAILARGTLPSPRSASRIDPPHEGEGKGLRFAFNSTDSMSGLIALERDLTTQGRSLAIFSEQIETGSHRASIVAVAEDRADVCAIDCRTWDLAKRFEPRAAELQAIGWTAKRLGLPFITSRHTPPPVVQALREALQALNKRESSG